jgi:hypothetical protein
MFGLWTRIFVLVLCPLSFALCESCHALELGTGLGTLASDQGLGLTDD